MEWKSPRKVEEEITLYGRKRFEDYFSAVDRGEISRKLAIQALSEEMEYLITVDEEELF